MEIISLAMIVIGVIAGVLGCLAALADALEDSHE